MKSGIDSKNRTTLDDLPFGEKPEHPYSGKELRKLKLPENVRHGMLYRDSFRIAWPSFLELLLTQLTSMADQIMVGHLPGQTGVQALSALGITLLPKFLMITVVAALNVGSTAVAARYRGRGEREKVNEVLRQALVLNLVMSVLFMLVGLASAPALLRMMGGKGLSKEAFAFALQYFRIQMYGFVPLCMTFTITALLRGIGDSRNPLFYNTLANIINIIFNYFLIFGRFGFPEMKVAGASLATVIGQNTAFVVALLMILNQKRYMHLENRTRFHFDAVMIKNIVRIGFPSMVEQLIMRLGLIIYVRTVTGLGDMAYATHQICMNIQNITFMVGQAFANAATTLTGQSLGKRRYDMAVSYSRDTCHLGLLVSALVGYAMIRYGSKIVALYTSIPEIISTGGKLLILVGLTQLPQTVQFILTGSLRGAGDTKFAAFAMLVTCLILRAGLAILMVSWMKIGLIGAWYALVVDQLVRSAMIFYHYRTGKWSRIQLQE